MSTLINAVCTDIDGTLLDSNRELSARTINAIKSIKDRVPVILASSRMPSALRHLQTQLEIKDHPIICYNGGYVLRYQEALAAPDVLDSIRIPLNICYRVLDAARKWPVHLSLYTNDEWFAPMEDQWTTREESITKVSPKIESLDLVLARWQIEKSGAHKIMIMGDAQHIADLYNELESSFSKDIHIYRSKDTYLELAPKQISKASALELVIRKWYGGTLSTVLAFGDNYNDVEMIKAVGLGVVVYNARPEVKAVANEVTLDSREDGVAVTLEKYATRIVARR